MRGKLTRLATGEKSGHLRTDSIVGEFDSSPALDKPFAILGAPLAESAPGTFARMIYTSRVKFAAFVESDNHWDFTTESGSEYRLDVLPAVEA